LASFLNSLVEGLWGNVRSVRPGDRSPFDACLLEEVRVPKRCKHRAPVEVVRKIDFATGPVVKDNMVAVSIRVSDLSDVIQIPHVPLTISFCKPPSPRL